MPCVQAGKLINLYVSRVASLEQTHKHLKLCSAYLLNVIFERDAF